MEDKINTGLHLDERKCEGEQGERNEETEGGREEWRKGEKGRKKRRGKKRECRLKRKGKGVVERVGDRETEEGEK